MDFCRKTILLMTIFSFMSVGWGQDCDEGYVPDCSGDGDCCSEDWIGDGYCDNEDQSWGCDLICYEEELSDCGHFPQLYYHPNELSEELEQNNSSNIIFTIVNNGDENLEWEVLNQDEIPNWLSFTIYGGFLEPGSLEEIDVTFDSSELNVGEYNSTITISSNDPFNEEIVVPVSLTIISQSLCDEGYTDIDGECYYQSDLDVLQDFIDLNQSLNGEEPLEIGDQEWYNKRLTYLGLGNRSLTTIPNNIGNLNHIEYLFLSSNQFSILPESIGNLSSLKFLFLGHNLLTVLPNTIGDLSSLESLYLHYNHLFILPNTICNLPQNCSPYLHNNYLCPPYPDCLTEDDIGYQNTSECEEPSLCDEETEVELWGECYNIEETTELDLIEGGLTGEIPSDIGNLTNLVGLYLDNNQLTGEIPPELGQLTNLTYLSLSHNQLTGEIPPEIGNLTDLFFLYLHNNQLNGEIPSNIGNLINLIVLFLGYNQLTGEIPIETGNLINIGWLSLHNNQLSGEIPDGVWNLSSLFQLDLYNNQFSGEIPIWICDLPIFYGLIFLQSNNLCPPYPECIEPLVGYQDTSECIECSDGDINGDYYINVLDVVTMVDCILINDCIECSDITGDGNTDVLDIVVLVGYILY